MSQNNNTTELTHQGYNAGHPRYYFQGGRRLSLKEIKQEAINSGYRGYDSDEIDRAAQMSEPRRSEILRTMREKFKMDLIDDVSRYRILAREMIKHGDQGLDSEIGRCCDDIHTNINLKHNHLYNDLAHLHAIDTLLNQQRDLFDF